MRFGFNDYTGFHIFGILFTLMFVLVFAMFLFVFIKLISGWNKNNHSPKLVVEATVVAKRQHISSHHYHHAEAMPMSGHSTFYYATFQVESGDRMELNVGSMEYGMLVEGDVGKLSFQGTRYLGFERLR